VVLLQVPPRVRQLLRLLLYVVLLVQTPLSASQAVLSDSVGSWVLSPQ
jgi:hypothetical protein